jgi:hypothetical protein
MFSSRNSPSYRCQSFQVRCHRIITHILYIKNVVEKIHIVVCSGINGHWRMLLSFLVRLNTRWKSHIHDGICWTVNGTVSAAIAMTEFRPMIWVDRLIAFVLSWSDEWGVWVAVRAQFCSHICMSEMLARLYKCVSWLRQHYSCCNSGRILSSGDPLYRVFVKYVIIGKADGRRIVQCTVRISVEPVVTEM